MKDSDNMDSIDNEEISIVRLAGTGIRRDYYANAFRKISSGQVIVWNWIAALSAGYWLIYHKMYNYTLLAFFSCITISGLFPLLETNHGFSQKRIFISIGCYLLCFICFGLFGNKLFFKCLQRKYKKGYDLNLKYKKQILPRQLFY
jgi:hypothetical protein